MRSKFTYKLNKTFISIFLGLLLMLFMSACGKKKVNTPKEVDKAPIQEKVVKKIAKVNPKTSLLGVKIDRTKTPYAGVWEPNDDETGFLLMYPDGKFESYGRFDRSCNKKPKKVGTYKVLGNKLLEMIINGKTKKVKLEVLSNFVKIKGFGLFWPPLGLALKAGQKEYTDPIKLVKFCRNVNTKSISKIYPYLTSKSKLELLKIGITGKSDFSAYYKFTDSIEHFLKEYKKIVSVTSVKKEGNSEVFKIVLKNLEGNTFGENLTITKEGDNLRCGFFDELKLVSTRKDSKETALWYKEMANKTKKYVFKSKELSSSGLVSSLSVEFNANNITIRELGSGNKVIKELKGVFKIMVNTPNVVAISLKGDKKISKKAEKVKETIQNNDEIIVFKFGVEEVITMLFKDKKFMMLDK